MTKTETTIQKNLEVAREMPMLAHDESSPKSSDVLNWIKKQPELQVLIFEELKSRGLIRYSRVFERWVGVRKEEAK